MGFGVGEGIATGILWKSVDDLRNVFYRLRAAKERYQNAGDLFQELEDDSQDCMKKTEELRDELGRYSFTKTEIKSMNKTIKKVQRAVDETVNKFLEKINNYGPDRFKNKCRAALGRKLREISRLLLDLQRQLDQVDAKLGARFRIVAQERLGDIQDNTNLLPKIHENVARIAANTENYAQPPPYEAAPSKSDISSGLSSRPSPTRTPIPSPEVHEDVKCDECGEMPIHGKRWHCESCPNHDLCDVCKYLGRAGPRCCLRQLSADETRARNRGMRNLASILQASIPEVHPGVICDSCGSPIRGKRWHCMRCPDQDLCDECHDVGAGGFFCQWQLVSVEETRARNDACADFLGAMARMILEDSD
ncbi:Fc.00g055140.m01.CDS01 [Cosmosporella sp. VM-42]